MVPPRRVGNGMQKTASTLSRIAAGLLVFAAACGNGRTPAVGATAVSRMYRVQYTPELDSENGLFLEALDDLGLSFTGELMNGLEPSYLDLNGLHPGGLSTDTFKHWFKHDMGTADRVMKYLVRCSLPVNYALSYTDDDTGATYTWYGLVGLAPTWTSGEAIPENEQQLVSGCIAAHVNKYGVHVPISLLGSYEDGTPLPMGVDELTNFPITEGCFFGNLFKNDGAFSGNDRAMSLTDAESSLRACALPDRSGGGASSNCPPLKYSGSCRDICQADPSGLYYTSCTVNGKSYLPFSTRIKPDVQFACGDGVCQPTESCGDGATWNNCGLDCGPCTSPVPSF